MASQSTIFRKVFVDSRYRSSGSHADFEIELPRDVSTTRTSSVYLASCSFSNTFETVLQGVNDKFYFLADRPGAPFPTPDSQYLYGLYRRDISINVPPGQRWLYYVSRRLVSGTPSYRLESAPAVNPLVYRTAGAFADEVTTRLRQAFNAQGDVPQPRATETAGHAWSFTLELTSADAAVQYWVPADEDLTSIPRWLAPNIVVATGAAPWPPAPEQSLNYILNMPGVIAPEADGAPAPFPYDRNFKPTQQGGTSRYYWPLLAFKAKMDDPPLTPPVTYERIADRLQGVLRAYFPGMVVTTSDGSFGYDLGRPDYVLQLISDAELRSPQWYAANWQGRGYPAYDLTDPKSFNRLLAIAAPTALVSTYNTPPHSPIASFAYAVPQNQYDGPGLAQALQTLLARAAPSATVSFDGVTGTMTFTVTAPYALRLPTERELRNPTWRAANWDPYLPFGLSPINWLSPESVNGQLFLPSPSQFLATTASGNIDLVPFREVYLASSITNYRTLQAGTAAQDIMARIPIDAPYGQIVVYRHLGPADALTASDMSFRTVRFTFRDWAGRVVPIDQPTIIELAFLDSDQYAM